MKELIESIDKDKLEAEISHLEAWQEELNPSEKIHLAAMRVALAMLDAKAIGWTDAVELRGLAKDKCAYMYDLDGNPNHDPRRQIKLYTIPMPINPSNDQQKTSGWLVGLNGETPTYTEDWAVVEDCMACGGYNYQEVFTVTPAGEKKEE
ncbi:hypothetical protein [Erwinia aphidicola]|uniref:hypothetical protein n=1 Tax=Erwinia aphidicola TaxID=68334 RepID=UPI003D1BA990